jgi:hypothetical protein
VRYGDEPGLLRILEEINLYLPDDWRMTRSSNNFRVFVHNAAGRPKMTAVPDEIFGLPADCWRTGDEVRYYYKDPGQALRMMNITKTDIHKTGR